MSANDRVTALMRNVERMLNALSLFPYFDGLEDGKNQLKALLQRLKGLSVGSLSRLARLEVEFYSIIECHPKLRQASQIAFKEELLDVCRDGLAYYAELQKQKPLSPTELTQLHTVEQEYQRVREELEHLESASLD